jgi:hypothetical protein
MRRNCVKCPQTRRVAGDGDQFGGEAVAPDRLCSHVRLALSSALGLDRSRP